MSELVNGVNNSVSAYEHDTYKHDKIFIYFEINIPLTRDLRLSFRNNCDSSKTLPLGLSQRSLDVPQPLLIPLHSVQKTATGHLQNKKAVAA